MDVLVALIDSSRGGEGRYPVRHYLAYMYLLADEDDAAIEPHDGCGHLERKRKRTKNPPNSKIPTTTKHKNFPDSGLRTIGKVGRQRSHKAREKRLH